jgi:hypothetical protein
VGLRIYRRELLAIINPIRLEARRVGQPAGQYVPQELAMEERRVAWCEAILHKSRRATWELFGVPISPEVGAVIIAALALYQDELTARLNAAQADPAKHPATIGPIEEQIRTIRDYGASWEAEGFSVSPVLEEVRRRRAARLGLSLPRPVSLNEALGRGEDQEIEFIDRFPQQAHDLGKEMSAFATSNAGAIFLGVADDCTVVGLPGLEQATAKDDLRKRIEGVSSRGIAPSITVMTDFLDTPHGVVARIGVPKGPEPIYYCRDIPYVRDGTQARPAKPHEVNLLVERYLERRRSS